MKPLRRGKVRTELGEQFSDLAHKIQYGGTAQAVSDEILVKTGDLQAALLGGAIEETCKEMSIDSPTFWRYTTENLWRLVRALEASGQLNKV